MNPSTASSRTLWQVENSIEKNLSFHDHAFSGCTEDQYIFIVGKSNAQSDWPFIHPGPLNASTGFRELSATIRFNLEEKSESVAYMLDISAREVSGPCPDLRVSINRVDGYFFPNPKRTSRAHGPTVPSPTAGLITRSIRIPADLLTIGLNEITFTTICVDKVDESELKPSMRPDLGWLFGSAIGWERISFLELANAEDRLSMSSRIELLPLFQRDSNGRIFELVDVIVENIENSESLSMTLRIGDLVFQEVFDKRIRFGDVRFRLKIPEFYESQEIFLRIEAQNGCSESTTRVTAPRKWIVHLIPHVHLDIGYTDVQAKVIEVHNRNIDKVLDILRTNTDYSFSIDGSFNVETYLNSRNEVRVNELIKSLQDGNISVNGIWALIFSGITGLEDFYRSLYFSANLRRNFKVPIQYANLTDVPSYSAALPSILSACGVNSFVGISNHTRGGNSDSDYLHLISPVNWVGPDGSSVLSYFSDHYSQLRLVCADPPTIAGVAQGLTRFLGRYEREDYLPNNFPLVGTHSDNEDLSDGYVDFVNRWNLLYEWPKLRFSTMSDYLDSVRPLRDELPTISGDGGSYWEDGMGTQAIPAAIHRRTQALLPGVEGVSSLAAAYTPGAIPDISSLDEAWKSILIGEEHTWTWAHTTSHPHSRQTADQLSWKVARIERGSRLALDESRRALSQLAELINADSLPSILVFNPSSWERDLFFDFEIDANSVITDSKLNPIEQFQVGEVIDGLKIVKARVLKVAPFGYALLPVIKTTKQYAQLGCMTNPNPNSFETDFYKVEFDLVTGNLTSLEHKLLDTEVLASQSEWSLGELLYVSGGGSATGRGLGKEKTSLYDYPPDLPAPQLSIEKSCLKFQKIEETPWSWVIISAGEGNTLEDIFREIELSKVTDEVQVRVTFNKHPNLAKESVYVAFPFNFHEPKVRYDRQIGWIEPKNENYIGACNEWFTIQNSVSLEDNSMAVSWSSADAPLFTVSDIVRGTWARTFKPDNGTIFSWVMNNYWMTNTPAQQGGRISLRYIFKPSQTFNPSNSGRVGRELRSMPLVSDLLHTDRGDSHRRPLNPNGTLWNMEVPENVVVTILASRNSAKFAVRIQEIGGLFTKFYLRNPMPDTLGLNTWIARCTATEDLVEIVNLNPSNSIAIEIKPWQVLTYSFGVGDSSEVTHLFHTQDWG